MEGIIYGADDIGWVIDRKRMSQEQDVSWLQWMRTERVGRKDFYTVLWFNCRYYSQLEFKFAQ